MDIKRIFKEPIFWIVVYALIVLGVRLFLAYQTPYFNYDAYITLRQTENIKATGFPLYSDDLSYGGKTHLSAPLYYYVLALFSIVFPLADVAKIVPNIFAVLLIIIVYFTCMKLSKSSRISFAAAFMSGFIPIMFFNVNAASMDYMTFVLIFGIIYCMFRLNERKYVDYALIFTFLLVLTSPLAFILIFGLLLYLLLLKLENLHVEMKETEIILFFTFLVVWVNLLIYKNAFLKHGFLVIWQNMPKQVLTNFFSSLTVLETFYTISAIPLIIGLYSIYHTFYKEKSKELLLLVGFCLGTFLLIWFKLLNLVTGLMLLSITLTILMGYGMKKMSEYADKTKLYRQKKLFSIILIVIFIITSIVPSIIIGNNRARLAPTTDDVLVLMWIQDNTPRKNTVAATLEEGDMVAYYSKRKNIMDTNYLLTDNINQRLADLDTIFQTKFETEAVSDLNKYNARYIYYSSKSLETYGSTPYLTHSNCFEELFKLGNSGVYHTDCKIR